jgi:hypothetical protein
MNVFASIYNTQTYVGLGFIVNKSPNISTYTIFPASIPPPIHPHKGAAVFDERRGKPRKVWLIKED